MLKALKDRSEAKEEEKSELNNAIGEESTQRSPIVDNAGKNLNPSSDSLERVGSTKILLNSGEGVENVVTPRHKGDVHVKEIRLEEINECNDNLGGDVQVNPSVKDTSGEDSYKTVKSHSSVEPTVADILTELKGKRVKRVLRKQGAPVKFVREKGPSPVKEDDDIMIVSSTVS
ncbi:hypothetical protein LIER_12651 [Lithospermum erythrorhizon]|uniref:Uncharacterized protein n=1 Tax=Lithospermum erythrorhizon TaxID=34254 RepID=A0AAV3PU04_LITER